MNLNLDRSRWTRHRFDEIALNVTERVDDPSSAGVDRYVGLEHLDPGSLTVNRWGTPDRVEAQKLRFQPGDVIFGRRRAYQKKVARADFEGICSAHALVLRAKSDVVDPDFLPVFLGSDYFLDRAISISVGSLSPTVNWRDIARQEFDLPPLDEQQRIADLIWALNKRRKNVAGIQKGVRRLSDLASTLLFENDSASVAKRVSDLCDEITVGVVVRPAGYYTDREDGVPALRSMNVRPGRFDLGELVRFRQDAHAALKKTTLRKGDVVVVRTGRPGDAAVVDESTDGFNCIDLIIVRVGPELDAHYIARFLNSTHGRAKVLKASAGTAQQHFNVGALSHLELRVPPLVRQQEVVAALENLDRPADVLAKEVESLSMLAATVNRAVFGGVS